VDVLLAFLGWFFGAIAAIAVAITVEHLRNPPLRFSVHQPDQLQARDPFQNNWRSLKVEVFNDPLPGWCWWLLRLPAQQCRAEISFLRENATQFIERPMPGRWAGTPEPAVAYVSGPHGVVPILTNPQELKPTVDLYPGDKELLDVVVRVQGEDECYGWNDEAYFYKDWLNPNLKLNRAVYLIDVTITSSGRKRTERFSLENDGPFTSFRLNHSYSKSASHLVRQ
jgi:hypothetical protein